MEGRKFKIFGVMMTLLLVFSMAATLTVSGTVTAGTQQWSQITIPNSDYLQLAPGTRVGEIAVSPDGGTLFAAIYVANDALLPDGYVTGNWYVVKSADGGYNWRNTGFTTAALANGPPPGDPLNTVVAIRVSPDWLNDGVVVVATDWDVYSSSNNGKDFSAASFQGIETISSMDVTLNPQGNIAMMIGTEVDVYVNDGMTFATWEPQFVDAGDNTLTDGVLAVAFSPNYGIDETIFAVINAVPGMDPEITKLRAQIVHSNDWGITITDGPFQDGATPIIADAACITFADDYNTMESVFVGLTAYQTPGDHTSAQMGDAFRVDLVRSVMGTSIVNDLNIRGEDTATNVNSLQVSGSAATAYILAGLRHLSNDGPMSTWQGQVHYSSNGGESWMQSYKPPSGIALFAPPVPPLQRTSPTLVMAPDFADSGIVYCSNGYMDGATVVQFSGFYVSTTMGTTFNGRGLLDHTINFITDIQPSPDYANDSTLFMVVNSDVCGLLWETGDGGSHWDLILGMTTMIPVPGVSIETVRIPAAYPVDPSIFASGQTDPVAGAPTNLIVRSTDEGNLWATTLRGPYVGGVPQVITEWQVVDKDTIIAATSNDVWKTTNMGASWTKADDTEIGAGEEVIDMELHNSTVIVGTDSGNVYICDNWMTDFSFNQVGNTITDANEVMVTFDADYSNNGIIYAGVRDGALNGGVWRKDVNSGTDWERISLAAGAVIDMDVHSIASDDNGILWAIAERAADSVAVRSVNPTAALSRVAWEIINDGLPAIPALETDLEIVPGSTHVFAIDSTQLEIWHYKDTLIKPTQLTPANGATTGDIIQGQAAARVLLTWAEMAEADEYQIQVALDQDFGTIVDDDTQEGTTYEIALFLGTEYFWRVRVNTGDPVVSKWSDTWRFVTPLGPGPARPILMSPEPGQTGVMLQPALQWTSTVTATNFELQVAENGDWANPVVNLTGASALGAVTAYQITSNLKEGATYHWRVRAVSDLTVSPWSDTGTFTTLTTPVEEPTTTPVWVWVVIALSAILLVGVIVLIVRTRRPV